ncbi:MAG: 50S ribosomal protein L11 methyltransferase [Bacteroidota bacterium]|nr:50S ribosomal protein L11 methyltransferase [Bacteroidota bacterium]
MDTIEVSIQVQNELLKELLIAELSNLQFDAFVEEDALLKAYIKADVFNETELNFILNKNDLNYSLSIIKDQNWNQLWESNFAPVIVDDFVGVRAEFHEKIEGVVHEILITPKMSFGTGHHATTFLVMQLMRKIDFKGKSVYDFGTGTGILAILAEKLGAGKVLAVDNDDWCIENSLENIQKNNSQVIEIHKVEDAKSNFKFDTILANINRNIIEDNISYLVDSLKNNSQLILSGLLESDEAAIVRLCENYQLKHIKTEKKNGWIAILLER